MNYRQSACGIQIHYNEQNNYSGFKKNAGRKWETTNHIIGAALEHGLVVQAHLNYVHTHTSLLPFHYNQQHYYHARGFRWMM